ncbi:MAG: DUF4330 domain-containing protein, partial [Eubacteriales bacterium]
GTVLKFLDEKGRLFGKVNLVDLLVVLAIVFAVGAVGWKVASPSVTSAVDSIRDIPPLTYEVRCINVDNTVATYAETQIGTQLMASGNMVDGYITDVLIEPGTEIILDSDGNPVVAENPSYKTVTFTVEANIEPVGNAYTVGTQEVRAGKTHIVKTLTLEVQGIVTEMEEAYFND